jgi:hypothetical protein
LEPVVLSGPAQLGNAEKRLDVTIAEADDDWPPADGDHVTVVVLFSDVRRVAHYRMSMEAELHRPVGEERGLVSFQNVTEPSLQQLT